MSKVRKFLIVRSDGEVRIVTRRPQLARDEVAVPIDIIMPPGWGTMRADPITVNMPEPPEVDTDEPIEPVEPDPTE